MGIQSTNQFDSSTEQQISREQFNFNFDLWAKAVKQQMLAALQQDSELTAEDRDQEDLPDTETLDDESE